MMMAVGGEEELPHKNNDAETDEFRLPPTDSAALRLKVGQQLGAIRRSRGISQEEAARGIKISRPHLSNIEQARARTDWPHLIEIARYYRLGIEEVIAAAESEAAAPPTRSKVAHPPGWQLSTDAPPASPEGRLTNHEALVINIWRALTPEHQRRVAKLLTDLAAAQFVATEKGQ